MGVPLARVSVGYGPFGHRSFTLHMSTVRVLSRLLELFVLLFLRGIEDG